MADTTYRDGDNTYTVLKKILQRLNDMVAGAYIDTQYNLGDDSQRVLEKILKNIDRQTTGTESSYRDGDDEIVLLAKIVDLLSA